MANNMRIAPTELARRIGEARRSRNLSQEDVANHLGLSRPTYIAIEKGTRPVKPEEIVSLAHLFGRSVNDLLNISSVINDFVPQFRVSEASRISKESISKAVDVFQSLCEDYLTLEQLMSSPMPHMVHPDYQGLVANTSVSIAAEQIAQSERLRLGLGHGPLPDLLSVMEGELELRVFIYPLEEFRIAGMFYYTDRLGGCIMINGTHPTTRQQWSLAHELGHFLADRYRQEVTVLFDYGRKPAHEQFADQFAAHFLMPSTGVRARFWRIVESKGDFKVADLCLLSDQYCVSVEAMARRLEVLQCIPRGMSEKFSGNSSSIAKVRAHLNLENLSPRRLRLPERYRNLAVQALMQEQITEGKLAKYLRCSRVESRDIVKELTQSTEINDEGLLYPLNLDFGETVSSNIGGTAIQNSSEVSEVEEMH